MQEKAQSKISDFATKDIVENLANADETLTNEQCQSIINSADPAALVSDLILILQDEELAAIDAPGKGIVPINAVKLLKQLKPLEAIEPMLQALVNSEYSDMIYSDIIFALADFGAPVLEPALKAFVACVAQENEAQGGIAEILSRIGVKDERIYSILIEMLEYDPELAAMLLQHYGDAAALPHLSTALDLTKSGDKTRIIELVAAIEALGGTLTSRQQKLWERKGTGAKSGRGQKKSGGTIYQLGKPGVGIRF